MADNSKDSMPLSGNIFADILLSRSFDDPAKIKQYSYGQELLSRIYKQQSVQDNLSYYGGRIARWRENRLWAKGRQNMKEFVDFTGIGGNSAYVNIDYKEQMKGNELYETLITFLSSNDEYPCVSAIDDNSVEEKTKAKQDALLRMMYQQQNAEMQGVTGLQLQDPNAYIPQNELEAEIKFQLDFQLDREIDFERKLNKVLAYNDYPQLKRRVYRDLAAVNCAVTKIERLPNGYIHIKNCIPENVIYNFFYADNGKMQISYIGEIYSLKVKDIRNKYGKTKERPDGLSEKEIFELGASSNQFNVSNKFYWSWTDTYIYSLDRPYDDYSIEVFDCEIEIPDGDYYVNKKDNFGKDNIQYKKNKPNLQPRENVSVTKQDKLTWYRGILAIRNNKMIYWGLPDVVIKPYMNIAQSLSSFSIEIPNNDGEYVPSIFERIIEPLREYTLCKLKRKQLIALLRPSGVTIDVEVLRDVDMGNGQTVSAKEVIEIFNQTGNVIYSSRGINPNERNEPPLKGIANAESIQQVIGLTNNIAACEQEMRALLGISIYMQGQQVASRTPNDLVETQNANASNVFGFLQTSFQGLMQQTLNKICMIYWDEEVIEKGQDGLMDTVFDVEVKMKPTIVEKQLLEQRINVALQNQLISFSDAERIRDMKNYKMASKYLAYREDKAKQDQLAQSQQMQQENAKLQQQSNLQAQAQKNEAEQAKLAMEAKLEEVKNKEKKEQLLLTAISDLRKAGVTIPNEWLVVEKELLTSIHLSLFMENKQSEAAINEGMQQAIQEVQQQQMQQQGGGQQQPMMQENPQEEQAEPQQEPAAQEQMEQQPQ